jgi:hypothetical protein
MIVHCVFPFPPDIWKIADIVLKNFPCVHHGKSIGFSEKYIPVHYLGDCHFSFQAIAISHPLSNRFVVECRHETPQGHTVRRTVHQADWRIEGHAGAPHTLERP